MISGMRNLRRSLSSKSGDFLAKYNFTSLKDYSGNSNHLSSIGNLAPTQTSDGYRLSDSILTTPTKEYVNHTAWTIQVVMIPHTIGFINGTSLNLKDSNWSTPFLAPCIYSNTDDRWAILRRTTETGGNYIMVDLVASLNQAVCLTAVYDGTNIYPRINKTGYSPTAHSIDWVVNELEFDVDDDADTTFVYAQILDVALTAAECDEQYDLIRAEVNSRPNVALP